MDGAAAGDHIRILILDPDAGRARPLCQALARTGAVRAVTAPAAELNLLRGGFDIAVVALEIGPRGGLFAAQEFLARNPDSDTVLFSVSPHSPETQAARALGIHRILPAARVASWLTDAAPLLGRTVLARRALRDSLSDLSAAPAPPRLEGHGPEEALVPLPLYEAERRFREGYLTWLLSSTRTLGEAAAKAGLPYRTLSQMIAKLGIRTRARPKFSPPRALTRV